MNMDNQQEEVKKYIHDNFPKHHVFTSSDIINAYITGRNNASRQIINWLEENLATEISIIYSGVAHISFYNVIEKLKNIFNINEET